MSAIKNRNTKPEMLVRSLIHRMGYRYRLHAGNLPGKPDLVFISRRKVIFVNGCFWHVHSCRAGQVIPATNSDFWDKKRHGTVERDQRNILALESAGWKVEVIWECEIKNGREIESRIINFLEN